MEIIKWTFIPVEYEYKRADYIWEMPPPLTEKPFTGEWSPIQEVPGEWTEVPAVLSAATDPPIVEDPPADALDQMPLDLQLPDEKSYLDQKFQEAMDGALDNISGAVGDAIVRLGKDFGMWILNVAPDTLGMIAMILCLGSIMSIPKTGKWAIISISLAVVFEILRRVTSG